MTLGTHSTFKRAINYLNDVSIPYTVDEHDRIHVQGALSFYSMYNDHGLSEHLAHADKLTIYPSQVGPEAGLYTVISLPALKTAGEIDVVGANMVLLAKSLVSANSIKVGTGSALIAPALKTVTTTVELISGSTFQANELEHVGDGIKHVHPIVSKFETKLDAPKLLDETEKGQLLEKPDDSVLTRRLKPRGRSGPV